MATRLAAAEQRVLLKGVSWETYERLLSEHQEASGTRFTYDDGDLEIMVLSADHEEPNRTLAALVEVLAEELGMELRRLGSTTFRRPDLRRGFEPHSAFYVARAPAVRGRKVDPAVDPAPDLVIEVDVTSRSLDRFPIFAAFGVPEVWRYDGARVAIFRLEGGRYVETESSGVFPPLTGAVATRLVEESTRLPSTEWVKRVREWARSR